MGQTSPIRRSHRGVGHDCCKHILFSPHQRAGQSVSNTYCYIFLYVCNFDTILSGCQLSSIIISMQNIYYYFFFESRMVFSSNISRHSPIVGMRTNPWTSSVRMDRNLNLHQHPSTKCLPFYVLYHTERRRHMRKCFLVVFPRTQLEYPPNTPSITPFGRRLSSVCFPANATKRFSDERRECSRYVIGCCYMMWWQKMGKITAEGIFSSRNFFSLHQIQHSLAYIKTRMDFSFSYTIFFFFF